MHRILEKNASLQLLITIYIMFATSLTRSAASRHLSSVASGNCRYTFSSVALSLENKVTIITGAANGIGYETAKLFHKHNANVIALDVDEANLEKLKNELQHERIDIHTCDVRDEKLIEQTMAGVFDKYGSLHVLCNIAAIVEFGTPFHKRTLSEMKKTVDNNFFGSVNCCYHAIPLMLKTVQLARAKGGDCFCSILNTSSLTTEKAWVGASDYIMSKYAINGLSKVLSAEYGASNIRCNTLKPGVVLTELLQNAEKNIDNSGGPPHALQDTVKGLAPLGRCASPEEIAHLYLWLASDQSQYVCGSEFLMDGGLSSATQFFPSFLEDTAE